MNIRMKDYSFYGIGEDEKERLLDMCQNLNDEQAELLLLCAKAASDNVLGPQIAMSLVYGIGFYKLRHYVRIPLCKADDFYGYRRRTLWIFKRQLEEQSQRILPEITCEGEGA